MADKREASRCVLMETQHWKLETGSLCAWLRDLTWSSLVGLNLEAGAKIKKTGSD